jgi:hypothetical protein
MASSFFWFEKDLHELSRQHSISSSYKVTQNAMKAHGG